MSNSCLQTKTILLYSCLLGCMMLSTASMQAQVIMEVMPNAKPMDASVLFYGSSNFNNGIPYSKIPGSPFLHDDWQQAALYSENDHQKWLVKTKLNLVSGEVFFINKLGEELVAPEGMIKKIVFYTSNDSAGAIYRNDYAEGLVNNMGKNNYMQAMNQGNYQLLKLLRRNVAEADSFHIAKRYFFRDEIRYFMQYNNKTAPLKKLSADNILVYLPGTAAYKDWIDKNNINFKKEDDIVRFLDYYNAKK